MNVLILVLTMLSLLAAMTYAQLRTFLDSTGVRIEYERYMVKHEREGINELEDRKYKQAHVDGQKDNGKLSSDKEAPLAKLHVKPLFTKPSDKPKNSEKGRNTSPNRTEVTTVVLKRLIEILYKQQPFYQEAIKKRPTLVDDLVAKMVETSSKATCKLKFTHVRDLANIPFGDDKDLREVFYKMLKGEPSSTRINEKGEEVLANDGYDSLLDYLTVARSPSRIRVWLARKALLQAIFKDPRPIIERRNELIRYIQDGSWTVQGAQQEFEMFNDAFNTDIDRDLLDFKVSKTRPPKD